MPIKQFEADIQGERNEHNTLERNYNCNMSRDTRSPARNSAYVSREGNRMKVKGKRGRFLTVSRNPTSVLVVYFYLRVDPNI